MFEAKRAYATAIYLAMMVRTDWTNRREPVRARSRARAYAGDHARSRLSRREQGPRAHVLRAAVVCRRLVRRHSAEPTPLYRPASAKPIETTLRRYVASYIPFGQKIIKKTLGSLSGL